MDIRLRLLGGARWLENDSVRDLPPRQPLLLGAYLACREDWVGRDELLALFWPEVDERSARHNLSQLLYTCRRQTWMTELEVEPSRVRWPVESDVRAFREALGAGAWAEAARLYRGALIETTPVLDAPAYGDWLETERQELHAGWREAALHHAEALAGAGEHGEAAGLLARLLAVDELAEDVLQAYMRQASAAGRRGEALRAFDTFRARLEIELDMEPLAATLALADAVRAGAGGAPGGPAVAAQPGERAAARALLPSYLTSFVGRERELADLAETLGQPDVRLTTLVGPGGSGKTRLAVQLARSLAPGFARGAAFVGLAPLTRAEQVPHAVAEALGVTLGGGGPPKAQLVEALRDTELLLVLDNAEHLPGAVDTVLALLDGAPRLIILATSREPLGLAGEHLYALTGLDYPAPGDRGDEDSDAVRLFLQSAKRARPQLALDAASRAAVVRVCARLGGLPLALELAANWLRLLSVEELLEEVSRDLDLLESAAPDAPARHRSLRATFDYSWALLTNEERDAMRALAVFRGGFTRDAATSVTGVALRTLLALVNRSLLGRTPAGRFERLTLVQQYASEKLHEEPELRASLERRHAETFLRLVEEADAQLQGPGQREALERLARDHDNVRAALAWCLREEALETGLRFASLLWDFWFTRGHAAEGLAFLEPLLALPGAETFAKLRVKAITSAGILASAVGDLATSRAWFERALALARTLGDERVLANAFNNLAIACHEAGDLADAFAHHEQGLAIRRGLGDPYDISVSLTNMGNVALDRGDHHRAKELFEEGLALRTDLGDKLQIAYSLTGLGNVAVALRDHGEARSLYSRALALRRDAGFRWGVAASLYCLATLDLEVGDAEAADARLREAAGISLEIGDPRGLAEALEGFAALAALTDRPRDALRRAGAAAATRERVGAPLAEAAAARLEERLEKARRELGEAAAAALAEGKRLRADESIRTILEAAPSPHASSRSPTPN